MSNKKVFIGNLPYSVEESSFKELFTSISFESIEFLKIEDGRPSGFAILTLNSSVDEAITTINSFEIDGRLISATQYLNY